MKTAKRMIAFLIISVFLFGLLPAALAEDDEDVLTSISHADASACTWNNSRTITLTVRNSYGDTLDLTNGLNIGWDSLRHKSVVATPELTSIEVSEDNSFEGTEISDLVVTYYMTSVSEGTQQYSTTYQIRAKRADPAPPVFSGTVRKETNYVLDSIIEFSSADFIPFFTNIDGEDIGAIAINGSNPTFGAIREGGESYELNTLDCITVNTDPLHRATRFFTFEANVRRNRVL
jgi:hypothetical protein